jgi:hypothetical protein
MHSFLSERTASRLYICRVRAKSDQLALIPLTEWLRRVLLTAEQTARTVWYFVAGVPG